MSAARHFWVNLGLDYTGGSAILAVFIINIKKTNVKQ
jgi:hypothetical protein